jgi:NADPH-dependent 2,4-dienoyl-CoA reductase/sulfur reductase-like enzyme
LPNHQLRLAQFVDLSYTKKVPVNSAINGGNMRPNKGIEKIVVIGGVAAGMSAASRARRNDPYLQVRVYEKSAYVSYGACGLPYYISDVIPKHENLVVMSPEQFREKRGIEVFTRHEAVSFNARARTVEIRNLETGQITHESYDKLIIATGASPVVPPFVSDGLDGVFVLRSIENGVSIRRFIERTRPRRAVVIGSGYIGLEMAENLKALGLDVIVIEKLPQVMPTMDADMAEILQKHVEEKGCRVKTGTEVTAIEGEQAVTGVVLNGEIKLACELVIISVGVRANTTFARTGGVEIGRSGAIAVNQKMETSVADVYAAGDCAEAGHLVTGKQTYIPLGTTANKQGRVAGDNASGRFSRFRGIVGTAVVKVFDLEAARTGLTLREAQAHNFNADEETIVGHSRAGYYPGAKKIHVKLVFRKDDGLLLGGQMIGAEGVAQRIDVLATALHQKMKIDDIAELDLAYAPPFSPVWDPLLIACNQAVKKTGNTTTRR